MSNQTSEASALAQSGSLLARIRKHTVACTYYSQYCWRKQQLRFSSFSIVAFASRLPLLWLIVTSVLLSVHLVIKIWGIPASNVSFDIRSIGSDSVGFLAWLQGVENIGRCTDKQQSALLKEATMDRCQVLVGGFERVQEYVGVACMAQATYTVG